MSGCSSCRFYRGTTVGYCHRYPQLTKASSMHWCGEYQAPDAPKVEPPISKKQNKSRLNFRPLTTAED